MNDPFTYICCAIPSETYSTRRVPFAHMAWAVGSGLTLLSSHPGVLRDAGGGLMVVGDQPYDRSDGDPRKLAQECLYVCRSLGLMGMVCDFEQPARGTLEAVVRECAEMFLSRGMSVYAPERYAHCHNALRVLIPTALTSGSLPNRLRQAASQYGSGRVTLEIERMSRDLPLPSPGGGNGVSISPENVSLLLSSRGAASFFSGELGARYFTYKDAAGQTHFVVYDDPGTFRYKAELAIQMGIREGFVLYPDMVGLGLL